jgi:hypothetical protein
LVTLLKLEASMAIATHRGRLVVIGLSGALFALAAQAEEVGGFVLESSKAAKLDNCVEPTEYMRRNHFELIRHQRDKTVYGGIRGTKHSLEVCVDCHATLPEGEGWNHEVAALHAHGGSGASAEVAGVLPPPTGSLVQVEGGESK